MNPPLHLGLKPTLLLLALSGGFVSHHANAETSLSKSANVHFTIKVQEMLTVNLHGNHLDVASNNGNVLLVNDNVATANLVALSGNANASIIIRSQDGGFVVATP